MGVMMDQEQDVPSMTRKIALAEKAMRAALEVLSIRVQYFRDFTQQG